MNKFFKENRMSVRIKNKTILCSRLKKEVNLSKYLLDIPAWPTFVNSLKTGINEPIESTSKKTEIVITENTKQIFLIWFLTIILKLSKCLFIYLKYFSMFVYDLYNLMNIFSHIYNFL